MLGRDGADAALGSNDGVNMLLSCLRYAIPTISWSRSSKSDVDDAFVETMTDQGAACAFGADKFEMFWCESTSTSFTDFLDLIKSSSKLQDVIKGIPRGVLVEHATLKNIYLEVLLQKHL